MRQLHVRRPSRRSDFPSIHCISSHHFFRQRGHVVIPFVPGFDAIAGKVLKLDHITDSNLRPLDELFRDHFLQCVWKNMEGVSEPVWDFEEAVGDGIIDQWRSDTWSSRWLTDCDGRTRFNSVP
jgi:hypothetical protein